MARRSEAAKAAPPGVSRRGVLAAAALVAAPAVALAGQGRSRRDVEIGGGRRLRLDLAIPQGRPPAGGYPLLVVLDGDTWFEVAAGLARARLLELDPIVVAGVGYERPRLLDPRRVRDLTPWPPTTPLDGPQAGFATGEADAFIGAVLDRLTPLVAAQAPIAAGRRAIFGHSLGALCVLHLMFKQPGAFDAYVAASPSIWWNKPRLLAESEAIRVGAPGPRVLLTAGGLEAELSDADVALLRKVYGADPKAFGGQSLDQVIADSRAKLLAYRMSANAREMAGLLRDKGLDASYAEFAGEGHNSSAPAALNRAMSFAFA